MTETTTIGWNWANIANVASGIITALEPVVDIVAPEAAPAVGVAIKLIQGAIAEEPAAVSLYNQIIKGTPVTAAQLQQFAADYEAAYRQLDADIAKKLASLPPDA